MDGDSTGWGHCRDGDTAGMGRTLWDGDTVEIGQCGESDAMGWGHHRDGDTMEMGTLWGQGHYRMGTSQGGDTTEMAMLWGTDTMEWGHHGMGTPWE